MTTGTLLEPLNKSSETLLKNLQIIALPSIPLNKLSSEHIANQQPELHYPLPATTDPSDAMNVYPTLAQQ